MTLSQLLLVLRVRRKLIFLILFGTVTLVMMMSVILPPSYKATATLVLNYTGIDPVTGIAYPGQMVPSYVQTQVGIIKSRASATRVVRELGLAQRADLQKKFKKATEGQGTIEDWLSEMLLKNLEVVPTRASNVVEVEYKARSAKEAATVANAFAAAYQETSLQLKVNPARSASAYLNQQMQTLRDNLMAAQNKLSAFQREKGLSSTDGRYDVESMRLSELSAQLVQVQGQLMDAQSRLRNFNNGGKEAPDIVANPLVQNLRIALAQAEANFTRIDERYMSDHPSWKQAKAELDRRRAAVAGSEKAISSSISNNAAILQQREAELRSAVEKQKVTVLNMNQARDQLALLGKEVDSAQAAYSAAFTRVTQTNLEGRFNQSDAAVLNAAVPPFSPSFPNMPINLALSLLAGAFLGIGMALLSELRDRRIRTIRDAADALQLPVLATLDWRPNADSNRVFFIRSAPKLLTR